MPSANRLVVAGVPHHITHRGHNRGEIFRDDVDCRYKLSLLLEGARRSSCRIHAYVLMRNHLHLIATPEHADGLPEMMHLAGKMYGDYHNFKYRRSGSAWERRYKSFVIDSDRYFLACSKYIEMNPVRASIVNYPGEYSWSSYLHNALGVTDRLITPHSLYEGLGENSSDRQQAYQSLFSSQLDQRVVDQIRRGFRLTRSKTKSRTRASLAEETDSLRSASMP